MFKETNPIHLLVIEDNPGDFVLLEKYLQMTSLANSHISHVVNLTEALQQVKEKEFDLALLDLSLPDSRGIESFTHLNSKTPTLPIIVLSGTSDLNVVLEAISLGAQDYLIKGEFDENLLSKSIQYSIERKKILENLRKSNERYEFVNKATHDTIWEWDYSTGEGRWGEGIIKTFGYTEEKINYDETWINEYIHPYDREEVTRRIQTCVESGIENWHGEYRFLCADGSYKHIYDRGYILFDENRKPYRMIGAMTDITERKQLEKDLAEQQVRQQKLITEVTIQAQEKERNELGRELHDNINQILATVKMYLGMAKSGTNTTEDLVSKSYDYVDEAMSEIRKLSHSLVAPSLGDIGLHEALEELVQEINKTRQLKIQLKNELNGTINDKNKELMLYRITQEQMNNVFKYSKAGNVTIHLQSMENYIHLSIADNGVGFDTTRMTKGIGLKNISSRVEFYSGRVNIVSSPGQGCKLEVYIPF